jgi:hypothetical protein
MKSFSTLSKLLCLVAAALTVGSAGAQSPSQAGGTVFGIAIDSVRGGVLPGAIVSIRGTTRSAFTDSLGRFSIENVAPGEVRLELVHPFLDTLGIAVVTAPATLVAGQNLRTFVSIPSQQSIVTAKCASQDVASGPGAVIGNVFNADTDRPTEGARVMLVWVDYELEGKVLVKKPRQRVTATGADGSFRICGLPEQLAANLNVQSGTTESPEIGLNLSPRLAVATLFLPSPDSTAPKVATPGQKLPEKGSITLTGRVLNSAGAPLPNARVSLDETDAVTVSGPDGRFTLTDLPAGTRILTVRAIGFEPVETAVPLRSRASGDLTVRMTRFALTLDTVRVTAMRDIAMQRIGFDERKSHGNGKFFDPEEIRRRDPLRLNNLLETLPGLTYSSSNAMGGRRTLSATRGRPLTYIVDGKIWRGGDDGPDFWISSNEIGAVEYYGQGYVPPEFFAMGAGSPLVVIWTKWYLRLR